MDSQHQTAVKGTISSLAQLGQAIKDNADRIQAHLTENNLENPAFSLGSPMRFGLPEPLEGARQDLFDDMEHLTALLRGPIGHILINSNPVTFHYTVVLSAISRFGIAEHVPTDGRPIAIKDLAAACHLKLADLMPLLRAAIANRTFEAVGDSEVKRNAPSAAIAAMPDLRHWLAYSNEDFIPAAFALPEAIAKWPGATSPDRAAFALLTPEHLALFDAISADPASAERFAGSMRLLGSAAAAEIPRIVEAPGFDSLAKDLVVVDVGGSMGEVLTQVLRRYSQINGVVQDLQPVIAKAQVPKDLDGRLTFQVADFFEPQTQEGAGVFVLRKVLHDWSDEYAEKIIRQLIPALRNGTKIVLNEICLPRHGETHPRREQNQRGWDLAMKWLLNGKERDEAEWRKLFTNIDARFKWVGARPVPAATSSLIEVLWEA